MEIESIWNNIPPFKKIEKGFGGKFGYGYWRKKGLEHGDKRNHKRQCLRQIRKYGFDNSETWGLDYTIMRWLSDNYGGFFRICGNPDNWNNYTLDGTYLDFWEHRKDKDYYEVTNKAEEARYNSFKVHLKHFLDNATPQEMKGMASFCSPRLRRLKELNHGWPATDDFPTFEDWQNELLNMADKFEEGTYSPYFISYFFSLWD